MGGRGANRPVAPLPAFPTLLPRGVDREAINPRAGEPYGTSGCSHAASRKRASRRFALGRIGKERLKRLVKLSQSGKGGGGQLEVGERTGPGVMIGLPVERQRNVVLLKLDKEQLGCPVYYLELPAYKGAEYGGFRIAVRERRLLRMEGPSALKRALVLFLFSF